MKFESMEEGKLNTVTVDTVANLLPLVAHAQESKIPYRVIGNENTVLFRGNMKYLQQQMNPKVKYTLRVKKKDGSTSVREFFDQINMAVEAAKADADHKPWYVVDANNKLLRKGNCENLGKTSVDQMDASMDPDIDIDDELDSINAMLDE